MESKYKTLIPLIIIFFIIGVAIGYVAHKPKTIEIQKPVEKIIYQNNTVYVTVTPTPPIVTATATAVATPLISDFTVRNYDRSTDNPTQTIKLTSNGANPNFVSIHLGDTVLIEITDYSSQSPLTLILNSTYSRNLGTSGAVIVNFNAKGSYSFKAVIPSSYQYVLPKTYAEGTISVY
ncbi:MAG: hypothetical protein O8C64_00580 [Candidatus Methanoperedens sp.]|nr:hypothetical protein [Candidatus Methanoperedens sp.]MCZ7404143.1 hypothetical protein [Candidatus Methanoperedens sp.]